MRIGSWARETTATTGTGTATLSGAVTGRATFTSMLSDGQVFPYVIEDGNNRESGIGTFTASGTTVARTIIQETLVAGSYNRTNPTAITLSGTAEIYIGDSPSRTFFPMVDCKPLNTTTKEIQAASSAQKTTANRGWLANRVYLTEFVLFGRAEIASLGIEIMTISTVGSSMKLGIYEYIGNRVWGLVDTTGNIVTNGTIGKKTSALSGGNIMLEAGLYALACGSNSDVVVNGVSGCESVMWQSRDYLNDISGLLFAGGFSTGSLLSTYTADNNTTDATIPRIWAVGA